MTEARHGSVARVTRRAVLQGALAVVPTACGRPVFAQQMQTQLPPGVSAKPKGPLVFRDYDQEELDFAYNQIPWAPNRADVSARNAQQRAAALARLGPPRRLTYGPSDVERLDLYATQAPNAPIHVFIHGGAWRGGSAAGAGFMSEAFVDAGAHFISLDFTDVREAGGNLLPMATQVRRAVAWVHANAANFGGDASRLYISGFSSGGHLAGVVLTTDWQGEYGLPADLVRGGLCCSGMFDLHPVSLSARRDYITFTDDAIEALSPQRHLEHLTAPLIVAYGRKETPEFQRQSLEFAEAVKAAGKPVTLLVGEGHNHFEMQETLGNPYGLLGRAVLAQMELGAATSASATADA